TDVGEADAADSPSAVVAATPTAMPDEMLTEDMASDAPIVALAETDEAATLSSESLALEEALPIVEPDAEMMEAVDEVPAEIDAEPPSAFASAPGEDSADVIEAASADEELEADALTGADDPVAAHAETAAEDEIDDTIPAPPPAAIERAGAPDALPRQGTLNSTVVLPPLDRADYVSRHRPAWLDMGDLGSLPGVTLDANSEPDAPVAKSPSVPSFGTHTVAADERVPQQVGDISALASPDAPAMDLADLADLADAPAASTSVAQDASTPHKSLRPPTRPLPRLDRDIMDTPRER
nr:hypothetical protein [Ktedonobacterales bacterium]